MSAGGDEERDEAVCEQAHRDGQRQVPWAYSLCQRGRHRPCPGRQPRFLQRHHSLVPHSIMRI